MNWFLLEKIGWATMAALGFAVLFLCPTSGAVGSHAAGSNRLHIKRIGS